jgi:7,8-dihydroneopterin aldolase/epimerase/oxygenase
MEAGSNPEVRVEVRGLSLFTHHGVTDAEQEAGQRLVVDVSFTVSDAAISTDRLEDTIDYAAVCELVAQTATERSYRTLERLVAVIRERLVERFGATGVRVRAAKPDPPLPHAVDEVAVEAWDVEPGAGEDV